MMMIKNRHLWTSLLVGAVIAGGAVAGNVTLPNVFQPNTPARASEVNANFSAVKAAVDDNASRIEQLTTAIEGADGGVTQGGARLRALESNLATLEGNVSTLQGNVSTLQGNVSTLQSNVSTLQGNVSTLQGNVSTLQTDVAALQQDQAINSAPYAAPTLLNGWQNVGGFWMTAGYKLDSSGFVRECPDFGVSPRGGSAKEHPWRESRRSSRRRSR
ncbi:MAG: hypothetical protein AB1730_10085 [Myxococcota bacterium]